MSPLNRREFLAAAAASAAALGLNGCSSSNSNQSSGPGPGSPGPSGSSPATTPGTRPLPDPNDAPFDTVVVLMMENRSFDHLLGWLPGANGKQAGLTFVDQQGQSHATWAMAPNWQGCDFQDPFHFWQAMDRHLNGGKCDGFLQTQPNGDLFPIGYYGAADVPILAALAQGYTTFDNYFASMLGPTWPNRLYQLCATTDLSATWFFPEPDQPRPSNLQLSIFDRLQAAGRTGAYYSYGEPMTGLFATKKYDSISYPAAQFFDDAKTGQLANVVFFDPDYTTHAEFNGTSNDYHPYGSVRVAEAFLASVHDALKNSPQWDRMIFVLNFDEAGGFYDHVAPPKVPDDTVLLGPGPNPDLTQLGFRVPAIAMGPFAPRQIDPTGPYEHCSVLKMIEWRWGLEPMTKRDATALNLARSLDFTTRRDPVDLPSFVPEPAVVCTNKKHLP